MNDLIEFNFGKKAISIIDRNGEAWFIAKDVCEVLGLANTSKAVDNLDQDEKGITNSYTHGGNQDVLIINESGFYKLVFRSRKAIAKKFTKWVTSKVLPAIRKQGGYISSSATKKQIDNLKAQIHNLEIEAEHFKMLAGMESSRAERWRANSQYGEISPNNGLPRMLKRRGAWVADPRMKSSVELDELQMTFRFK